MKRLSLIRIILMVAVTTTITSNVAFAQFGDAGAIIQAGKEDANLIMQEYMKPGLQGFSSGLNTGWFSTAGTHGLLGFSLMFRANAAVVPDELRTFNLNDLNLQKVSPTGSPIASSLFGPKRPTEVEIDFGNPMVPNERFNIPRGIDWGFVPSLMAQASIGLPKNTDLTIRYAPPVTIPRAKVDLGLFGLGFKHDIKQWIPVVKYVPIDISVAAGFTRLSAVAELDEKPTDNTRPGANQSNWDNQEITFKSTGTNINVLVGKSLPFISGYVGLGYETSKTDFDVKGDFPVPSADANGPRYDRVTDPISFSIDGVNSVRALAGVRLRLAIITFSADVVYAEMPLYSVGFGISFR